VGVIDKFERGIERVVNGAFAKAFRSEVQPVELASALRREADTQAAVMGRGRTLVPNVYTITLGSSDHERVSAWQDALVDELTSSVTEHARQQQYSFVGPVSVRFTVDEDLPTGVYEVKSQRAKGTVAPAATAAVATVNHPVLDVDGRRYQLTATRTVLGRGSEADIVVDDPGVSRKHAEITLTGDGAVIKDLGSTNGTFVDEQRISTRRLHDGTQINMGRTRITFNSPENDG